MQHKLVFALIFSASIIATSAARPQASAAETKTTTTSSQAHKSTAKKSSKSKTALSRKKKTVGSRKVSPQKARRMTRAFVASSDLKPMARQLIDQRTPAAYAGVQSYATRHAGTDPGAMANLALGYAHILDHDYAKALPNLAKAQQRAGELADYVKYFQAQAYQGLGDNDKVITTLRGFEQNFPESVFHREVVDLYGNALVANGNSREAINYLEAHRTPTRASVELALGRAYLKAGETQKSMEVLRHLYFTMPSSAEATDAATLMQSQGSALLGSYVEHQQRAQLLEKAGRYSDAANEYRAMMAEAPQDARNNLQISLASAMRKAGDSRGSRSILESVTATGDSEAMRLYLLGEIAKNEDNESAFLANLAKVREVGPTSPALESALMSAGNYYLLRKDYDKAIDAFRELQQRFPKGQRASYANWKAAWLSYRQGRSNDAKQGFEHQVDWYPLGTEVPAALYWRARIAENEGDVALARAYYGKLADRFRNYYYGFMATPRLAALPAPASTALHDPILDKLAPTAQPGDDAQETTPPEGDLRLEKSKLLMNAGLTDFAVHELQAAGGGSGANWATLQIARIYQDAGLYHRALQFLKRSVNNYYSLEITALPRPYWEALFPKPYWVDVRRAATENGLDPYMVASLIRQESEFNPGAVSHANAWGLMQLLPGTGKTEAKQVGIRRFTTGQLLEPTTNIRLGTRFFRKMVDEYNGQVEYALAAYNAGTNRVDDWRTVGHYNDIAEFVESIPFTETREYVQAIVRNAQIYKRLYPAEATPAHATPVAEKASAKPKPSVSE
ncbi:MAG TPA: transglycosylase SLT domain-containing protein [Candidatus Acidoferrales bacterium]|nr:transglycosylase SLT domain-containing protein [Candidatus Acidoferrales bacterium]